MSEAKPEPIPPALARIGDFTIVREIGRGGMGVVYEATQDGVNRRVALKVVPASHGDDVIRRFEREARAAGSLKHPGIVPVYAFGEDGGLHYIAMEHVEGPTLDRLLDDTRARRDTLADGSDATTQTADTPSSPLPGDPIRVRRPDSRHYLARVAELFAGVARGLAAAHQGGVLHRDVKPSNLILDPSGSLRVLDFGLARLRDMGRITHTGETIGTPRYIAPEVINARRGTVDQRCDVYSLGVSLFEALTLEPAFTGDSPEEILLKVLDQEPRAPRSINPAIPRDLETIVLRALAKRPGDRYPDAAAMAEDLERFVEGLAPRARRMGPATRSVRWVARHRIAVASITVIAVLAVCLGVLVWKNTHDEQRRSFDLLMAEAHQQLSGAGLGDDASPTDRVISASSLFARASDLRPDQAEPMFYRAICQLELGDVATARAFLETAIAREPSFHAARVVLADLLRNSGDTAGADAMLAAMPSSAGEIRPESLFYEAQAHFHAGRPRDAFGKFTAALDHRVADPYLKYRAFLGRGDAAVALGDNVQALEDYAAARTLRGETPEVMLKLARLHFRAGRPERAKKCLNAVAPEEERRAQPFLWVASLLEQIGRGRDALPWVERAVARAPENPDVLARQAWLFLTIGEPRRALVAANRAIAIQSDHALATEVKGRAQLAMRQLDPAIQTLAQASRLAPTNARANRWLAAAFTQRGDQRRAIEASRKAVRLAPRDVDARILLAENLTRSGKLDVAVDQLAGFVQTAPREHFVRQRHNAIAQHFEKRNSSFHRALAVTGVLVRLKHPNAAKSACRLVDRAGEDRKKLHRACKTLERVKPLAPTDDGLLLALGSTYGKLGRARDLEDLLVELERCPRATADLTRARLFARTGRAALAVPALKRALERGANRTEIAKIPELAALISDRAPTATDRSRERR